jgi:hypothetical protein
MAAKAQSSKSVEEPSSLNMEEKIISLFEPDTLASAQYFQNFRRKATLEPEMRLMLSMLEDAVRCFQIYLTARSGKRKRLFNESGGVDPWQSTTIGFFRSRTCVRC